MTPEQVVAACEKYREAIQSRGYTAERAATDKKGPPRSAVYPHLVWMCEQTKVAASENMEKACRWLGFIQGVLWSQGIYSIDEMRDDNR